MTVQVTECTVSNCSFNDHTNCNATGITIGGASDHAQCATISDAGSWRPAQGPRLRRWLPAG